MKPKFLIISGFLLSFAIGFMVGQIILVHTQKPNEIVKQVIDRSLDKYTIDNLSKAEIKSGQINIVKQIKEYPEFTSSEFEMSFDPNLNGKTKKTSGLVNIPKGTGQYPLIVMIRGYVPQEQYFIGNGTINASLFFAKNGFMTISPDFLGFGDSDIESSNIFESRFETYTTVLSLLKSVDSIPSWDHKNIEIWAHSNGGQIALTTLEITGVEYPTVLWAPVSSSFPFSVLYYSDEADDKGKNLRKELAKFEDIYNTDLYSLENYLTRIKAKINLDQGTADDAVPVFWSDSLAETLKGQDKDKIIYNVYPGADHVMSPIWDKVIEKDLTFFKENLRR